MTQERLPSYGIDDPIHPDETTISEQGGTKTVEQKYTHGSQSESTLKESQPTSYEEPKLRQSPPMPDELTDDRPVVSEKELQQPSESAPIVPIWDGNTPIIGKLMLMRHYNWLQFSKINDIGEQRIREQNRKYYGRTIDIIYLHNYGYIDRLYDKPIDDYRGFCIWRIFVPYFINIKRLSTLETSDKIRDWLGRCNTLKPLSFRPESKIR